MSKENTYSLYIVECADGTYYTGICTDLERRLEEHNTDDKKGAKYTKVRRPVKLVFSVSDIKNRKLASRGEFHLKKLTRSKKQLLINGDNRLLQWLGSLLEVSLLE